MLKIDAKHIKDKDEIGSLDGHPVHKLVTYGGLVIIAMMKGGEPEVIGLGSHQAIAKHLAEKKYPKITWKDA